MLGSSPDVPLVSPNSASHVGQTPKLGIAPAKPTVLSAVALNNTPMKNPLVVHEKARSLTATSPDSLETPVVPSDSSPVPSDTSPVSPDSSPDYSEEMPATLLAQLNEFEQWAVGNQRDARNDAIKFWVLKIPAIVASASAGIFAYYKWEVVPLFAGAIAGVCVLIDGLNPGGALRNAHYKAFFELRQLETAMQTSWRVDVYKTTTALERRALASRIIKDAQKRWEQISEDLKKAETLAAK